MDNRYNTIGTIQKIRLDTYDYTILYTRSDVQIDLE
jgi:hypothetical protein